MACGSAMRGASCHAAKRVVLAAHGISADGRRELLDYRQATAESTMAWGVLLRSLVERGLDPDGVVLVAADGADGIASAVAEAFRDASLQRCWTHRVRATCSMQSRSPSERAPCADCGRSIGRRPKRAAVAAYWRSLFQQISDATSGMSSSPSLSSFDIVSYSLHSQGIIAWVPSTNRASEQTRICGSL
jgi:transposase-like protein